MLQHLDSTKLQWMAIEEYGCFNTPDSTNLQWMAIEEYGCFNTQYSTKLQWTATTKPGHSRIVEHEHRAIEEYGCFNIWILQNYSGWQLKNTIPQNTSMDARLHKTTVDRNNKTGRSGIVEHEHRATAEHQYLNIRTLQNYSGWQLKNTDTSTSRLHKFTVDRNNKTWTFRNRRP